MFLILQKFSFCFLLVRVPEFIFKACIFLWMIVSLQISNNFSLLHCLGPSSIKIRKVGIVYYVYLQSYPVENLLMSHKKFGLFTLV